MPTTANFRTVVATISGICAIAFPTRVYQRWVSSSCPATVEHIGELLFSASKKTDRRWMITLFLSECVGYGHLTDHERSAKVIVGRRL